MMGGHQIHWLPLGLVGILAALGFWLNQLIHQPIMVDNAGFSHEPDAIVEKFNALAFDSAGNPMHRLTTDRLTHYLDDDTNALDNPAFHILDKRGLPVKISARRGLVSTTGEHIHFLGNVKLVRQDTSGNTPFTLESEYLWITPDAGIMQTDKPVTLRQGGNIITARAMQADSRTQIITLSGGVRGTYEKTH